MQSRLKALAAAWALIVAIAMSRPNVSIILVCRFLLGRQIAPANQGSFNASTNILRQIESKILNVELFDVAQQLQQIALIHHGEHQRMWRV